MVSLHYPFRNEDSEILAEFKFVTTYHENENSIQNRREDFESNIDIQKTTGIFRDLCLIDQNNDDDPFEQLQVFNNPSTEMNSDIHI